MATAARWFLQEGAFLAGQVSRREEKEDHYAVLQEQASGPVELMPCSCCVYKFVTRMYVYPFCEFLQSGFCDQSCVTVTWK